MKNLTLKNHKKATDLIIAKGYTKEEAENIAINCFAMASVFKSTVEIYINNLSDK